MKKTIIILITLFAATSLLYTACTQTKEQTKDQINTQKKPPEFVYIEGGTFMMGSPDSEVSRGSGEVQHRVTISPFYISNYQVTQKEYKKVMRTNPSEFKGDNLPVENVTWYDAIEYCNKRSIKEGLTPAYTIDKSRKDPNNENVYDDKKWTVTWNKKANGYRLPTEAEWEYACRAGTTTPFNTGNNITTDQANYKGTYPYNNNGKGFDSYRGDIDVFGNPYNHNPTGICREKTTPVGSFAPNPWGLYDMHGNVWEWCWDWRGAYSTESQTDPVGAVAGAYRVIRGGAWGTRGHNLRSANRSHVNTFYRNSDGGFRLVRSSIGK